MFKNELYISFHSQTRTMVLLTGCLLEHLMLEAKSGNRDGFVFRNNGQTGMFPQEQSKMNIASRS